MHAAVMERAAGRDVVIMAAAVADYTPAATSPQKVKKSDGPVTITLTRTKDILGELGKLPSRKRSGGPCWSASPLKRTTSSPTRRTSSRRRASISIVANDVSRADAGFDVDTNAVTLVSPAGAEELPLQTKNAVAATILDRVEELLARRSRREATASGSRRNHVA